MSLKHIVKAAIAKSEVERRQHISAFYLTRPFQTRKKIWDELCSGFQGRNCYDDAWTKTKDKDLQSYCDNDYIHFPAAGNALVKAVMDDIDISKMPADKFGRINKSLQHIKMGDFYNLLENGVMVFLEKLYGRDFWFRESPFLMIHPPARAKEHIQAKWHVDGFNQVTMIILCEDNENDGTATQFLCGSAQEDWHFERDDNRLPEDKYDIKTCYGKKGDVFIINAGQALHRSLVGNGRKAIFVNFSSGVYEKKFFGI